MNKIRLMTAITAVFIISLPFAWIFIDEHIIAKITLSLLGILNIIVTYSTYTNYKKHHNVEYFSRKGLIYMSLGFGIMCLVLLTILLIKGF